MDKDIRIVFMGTPSFARNVLEGLVNNEYNVVLCVSQEDKERDRKGNLVETAVKSYARSKGIDVFTPHRIRDEYEEVLKYKPDIVITCAYGQIIPKVILDYPRLGCINVHGSLLPKYRGGAPIHWAIMNGEKETGISIMYMSEKMDAGDIISQRSMVIGDGDILDDVYEKMSFLGRDLLLDTLPSIIDGTNERRVQDESLVSFGYNVKREEERLDFNWSSRDVYNRIRGLSTVPGAYFTLNGKRIKVYASRVTNRMNGENGEIVDINRDGLFINASDGTIVILDMKIEGKKRCLVRDFVNGCKREEFVHLIVNAGE